MTLHHLRIAAGPELRAEARPRARFAAWAALPIAALVAISALGGILVPATYARETASWAAQGIGQDWVSLLVVVPVLLVTAVLALRGSRSAALLLGGALLYVAYSYVLYAFAVHFNWLFLVYCGALGLSVFALIHLLATADPPPPGRAPIRTTAAVLFVVAGLFGVLWLAQIVPALVRGEPPAELAETGHMTNPVHALDLSLLLPSLVIAGVALLRRRPIGLLLAPIALAFCVLMALAIGGMMLAMSLRGLAFEVPPLVAMAIVAAACLAVLILFLRRTAAPAGGWETVLHTVSQPINFAPRSGP